MKLQALGDYKRRNNRACLMSDSEIITIMIGFHLGATKHLNITISKLFSEVE